MAPKIPARSPLKGTPMSAPINVSAALADRDTRLAPAFALVDPAAHARFLAERGFISNDAASRISWKDPISALVTKAELRAEGLSIQDVAEAVAFYTATEASVLPVTVGRRSGHEGTGGPGYLVTALGYHRGPAGP
jgi:hypothetical protein